MRSNFETFNDRMKRGREYEAKMIARLRADGHYVERASANDDMYNKFDIYLNGYRTQLKHRETGDDFILEVERPVGTTGRDMQGTAEVVIMFNRNDDYRVVSAAKLKRFALKLANAAKQQWGSELNGTEIYKDAQGNMVRARYDESADATAHGGSIKIMAYVNPDAVNAVKSEIRMEN